MVWNRLNTVSTIFLLDALHLWRAGGLASFQWVGLLHWWLLTTIVAGVWLAPAMHRGRVRFVEEPDYPVSFGPDMAWLAIRTHDTTRRRSTHSVSLTLRSLTGRQELALCRRPCLVQDSYLCHHLSRTGPLWSVLGLPQPFGDAFVDKAIPLWTKLSRAFKDVQTYATFPEIDFYAWGLLQDGKIKRIFAVNDVGVVCSHGRITRDERALGLKLFDMRGMRERKGDAGGKMILYPTETQVMQLARTWSLDPTRLSEIGEGLEPATGIVGRAPTAWLAERVNKKVATSQELSD